MALFAMALFACTPSETAIRAELRFGECLDPSRVERVTVTLVSETTTITRNLSRASYRIRDGFAIRLVQADEMAGNVTISVALLGRMDDLLAETSGITATFEPGRVVPAMIDVDCGPCRSNPACGMNDPAACGSPADCDPCARPEVCGNSADDDCDLLVDCCDDACSADPFCSVMGPPSYEICGDSQDNDCNWAVDCDDPACLGQAECPCSSPFEICGNGLDDDCNGASDCSDPQCGMVCCVYSGPEAGQCADYIDNDCDSLIDCCDDDCAGASECATPRAESADSMDACWNFIDDDCDSLIDCCDEGCAMSEPCTFRMDMPGLPPGCSIR